MRSSVDMRIDSHSIRARAVASSDATLRFAHFAARIATRYEARSPERRMPLSMVFARPWRFQTVTQRFWQAFSFRVAPHVHLRLQTSGPAREAGDTGVTIPVPSRSAEPVAANRLVNSFVEYVHARARRVEATFGSTAAPVNTPIPRVNRRPAPVASRTHPDAASLETRTLLAPRTDASAAARHAAKVAAPVVDVERLTEQVINGIDRRIIAQRERFGRI